MDSVSNENCQSLCRNGGFEESSPPGLVPIGWEFRNIGLNPAVVAAQAEQTQEACEVDKQQLTTQIDIQNFWQRKVSPQKFPGYRSYIECSIGSPQYAEMQMLLSNRQYFDPWIAGPAPTPPYAAAAGFKPFAAYADDLKYTISFSVKVLGGKGKISVFSEWTNGTALLRVNDAGQNLNSSPPDLIATNLKKTPEWERYSFSGRFYVPNVAYRLIGPVLRFEKLSADPFVFLFSAALVVAGQYSNVPYMGDLSYDIDPRNIVLVSYGNGCPPGFREADLDGTKFIKVTDMVAEVLTEGGSEFHTHEIGSAELNLNASDSLDQSNRNPSMRMAPHTHIAGDGVSNPPSRSIGVCVKC